MAKRKIPMLFVRGDGVILVCDDFSLYRHDDGLS